MAWQWADVVGATLVVAQDWAGTRPAPTGEGLVKWTSSFRSFRLIKGLLEISDSLSLDGKLVTVQLIDGQSITSDIETGIPAKNE